MDLDRIHQVAHAWRARWEDGEEDHPPHVCECGMPADGVDSEGVDLCKECLDELERDHHRELIAAVRSYLEEHRDPTRVPKVDRLQALVREAP